MRTDNEYSAEGLPFREFEWQSIWTKKLFIIHRFLLQLAVTVMKGGTENVEARWMSGVHHNQAQRGALHDRMFCQFGVFSCLGEMELKVLVVLDAWLVSYLLRMARALIQGGNRVGVQG